MLVVIHYLLNNIFNMRCSKNIKINYNIMYNYSIRSLIKLLKDEIILQNKKFKP